MIIPTNIKLRNKKLLIILYSGRHLIYLRGDQSNIVELAIPITRSYYRSSLKPY